MTDTVCFLDANVVAAPVTRTLFVAGAREDGLIAQWSAHVEAEADRHSRPGATLPSHVRRTLLGTELSPSAPSTTGLSTKSAADRQVLADAILAKAKYVVTVDVDDFAAEDLTAHGMSAVNPDYFMALRFSEDAYRAGVVILSSGMTNPPRSGAEVHRMLGRRHPRVSAQFAAAFDSAPVDANADQPTVIFRGVICVRCEKPLQTDEELRFGLCAEHLRSAGDQPQPANDEHISGMPGVPPPEPSSRSVASRGERRARQRR